MDSQYCMNYGSAAAVLPTETPPINGQSKIDHVAGSTGSSKLKMVNTLVRVVGAVVLVPALVLMATDEQTFSISVLKVKAKFSDAKAFDAFVAASGTCIAYLLLSAIALLIFRRPARSTFNSSSHNGTAGIWLIFLLDQAMTFFLLGATTASTEVAYISKHGSSKAGWSPICDQFNRFCNHAAAALGLGYAGVLALAISTAITVKELVAVSNQ